jgi:hypothetical protein
MCSAFSLRNTKTNTCRNWLSNSVLEIQAHAAPLSRT